MEYLLNQRIVMLRLSMLLGCIFMTNSANNVDQQNHTDKSNTTDQMILINTISKRELATPSATDFSDSHNKYSVTCYICVNVSDNPVCNQFAIDRPCKPGETFCHTLHIMDSKGTSVLVNKKCTSEIECQRNKVGCVEIDSQKMCVSCCDSNYCNKEVPTNSSTSLFDDKITKMRKMAVNMFREREKALTTSIKDSSSSSSKNGLHNKCNFHYARISENALLTMLLLLLLLLLSLKQNLSIYQ